MKRWFLAASVMVALSIPAGLSAQTGASGSGFGGGTGSTGGSGRGTGTSGSSTGLAGTANTTLLGNQVNLNFNSVFGTTATLANTSASPFTAYQPSGSGTTTGTGGSFSGGSGISNSGFGSGTGGLTSGTGARTGGTGLTGGGLGGSLGTGGVAGGLGGNRGSLTGGGLTSGGLAGGSLGGGLGGSRSMLGGGMMGAAGGFLGGASGMNNQQSNANTTIGYRVNYNGIGGTQAPTNVNLTTNADFQQRLVSAPGMQSAVGLQVFTRGDTAILRGQVGSDYAKQLADAMIRLEPGVYNVQNELVVVPQK